MSELIIGVSVIVVYIILGIIAGNIKLYVSRKSCGHYSASGGPKCIPGDTDQQHRDEAGFVGLFWPCVCIFYVVRGIAIRIYLPFKKFNDFLRDRIEGKDKKDEPRKRKAQKKSGAEEASSPTQAGETDSKAKEGAEEGAGEEVNSPPCTNKPIIGYRSWHISDNIPVLKSTGNSGNVWKPGIGTAKCTNSTNELDHKAPAENCGCGFYFRHSVWQVVENVANYNNEKFTVIGSIVAWGDYIEGENCTRAEKIYIAAIYSPGETDYEHLINKIGEEYNVPVVHSFQELTEKAELLAKEMAGGIDEEFEGIVQSSFDKDEE